MHNWSVDQITGIWLRTFSNIHNCVSKIPIYHSSTEIVTWTIFCYINSKYNLPRNMSLKPSMFSSFLLHLSFLFLLRSSFQTHIIEHYWSYFFEGSISYVFTGHICNWIILLYSDKVRDHRCRSNIDDVCFKNLRPNSKQKPFEEELLALFCRKWISMLYVSVIW